MTNHSAAFSLLASLVLEAFRKEHDFIHATNIAHESEFAFSGESKGAKSGGKGDSLVFQAQKEANEYTYQKMA